MLTNWQLHYICMSMSHAHSHLQLYVILIHAFHQGMGRMASSLSGSKNECGQPCDGAIFDAIISCVAFVSLITTQLQSLSVGGFPRYYKSWKFWKLFWQFSLLKRNKEAFRFIEWLSPTPGLYLSVIVRRWEGFWVCKFMLQMYIMQDRTSKPIKKK